MGDVGTRINMKFYMKQLLEELSGLTEGCHRVQRTFFVEEKAERRNENKRKV
jgi:hypothetical protein